MSDAQFTVLEERADVDAAFEALKAATPPRYMSEFGRMMLMASRGTEHQFKHKDMRRTFTFDTATATFSGQDGEGEITTAEEAYQWASS